MTKRLAKRNLISFSILAILLIFLCVINIAIPTTNYRFVGFANAIVKDIDINGGFSAQYQIVFDEGEADKVGTLNNAVKVLNNKLALYGYGSSTVSVSGLDKIYVEIPNLKSAKNILTTIGTMGDISLKNSDISGTEITFQDIDDIVIVFAQTSSSGYSWGINIMFNDSGKTKIKTLTASGSGTISVYIGEDKIDISFSETVNSNTFGFSMQNATQDSINAYALKYVMASQNLEFEMTNNQITEIAPILNQNMLTLTLIALAVIVGLFLAVMFSKFGDFGYLVLLSLTFLVTILMFFLQAIPIYTLSYAGIIGGIVGLLLFFISNFVIFNNIKNGYAEGKKLPLAVKAGFKKSVMPIVDISVLTIIASIFVGLIGGAFAMSFAMLLAVVSGLNLLLTLIFTKLFAKWYLAINSTKVERLNLKREAHINELD
ncbi:MAG: hypothetical protein PHQ62_03235 [Clostridia bacterium]|nr:hypothetical protein [Clostridia bacterium]